MSVKKKTTKKETNKITKKKIVKRKKGAEEMGEVTSRVRKGVELSVIIPAYNEVKRLPITLLDVDRKLREMDLKYEILVVDDGSTDGTPEMVEKFIPLINGLRLIANPENHGKGYVVRQGMLEAEGEARLFTDADNSTSIDQFDKMRPYLTDGVPVVIGSRAIKGAELDPPQPVMKQILGKFGNLFIQVVALPGVWDTQCGFKAFSAVAAEDIFNRSRSCGWAFDIEALVLAKKLGYEIAEVPVHWVNDIHSHVKAMTYLQVLWETVLIAWRLRKDKGGDEGLRPTERDWGDN